MIAIPEIEVPPLVGKYLEPVFLNGPTQRVSGAPLLGGAAGPVGMGVNAEVIECAGHRDFLAVGQIVKPDIHRTAAIVT
jgi:hypothetical protein